jgi:hypothetical protein
MTRDPPPPPASPPPSSPPRREIRRSWTEIWKQSSPRRRHDSSPRRERESPADERAATTLDSKGDRWRNRSGRQVSNGDLRGNRARGLQCSGSTRTSPDPTDEGGEIVDFFGQLWLIPDEKSPLKTPRSRVRPGERGCNPGLD